MMRLLEGGAVRLVGQSAGGAVWGCVGAFSEDWTSRLRREAITRDRLVPETDSGRQSDNEATASRQVTSIRWPDVPPSAGNIRCRIESAVPSPYIP